MLARLKPPPGGVKETTKGEKMETTNKEYKKAIERDGGKCCVCKRITNDTTLQTKCTFPFLKYFSGQYKPTAADVVTVCKHCAGQYAEMRRVECKADASKGGAPYLQLTAAGWIEQR